MPITLVKGTLVRDFETKEVGGRWGTVKGKHRLVMPAELREFAESERPGLVRKFGNSARADAEFYARVVVAWDVLTADGKAADPSDPENYLGLPVPVFEQFEAIVGGFTAEAALGNSAPSSPS